MLIDLPSIINYTIYDQNRYLMVYASQIKLSHRFKCPSQTDCWSKLSVNLMLVINNYLLIYQMPILLIYQMHCLYSIKNLSKINCVLGTRY